MRNIVMGWTLALLFLPALSAAQEPMRETLYQVATIESLLQGIYDGGISIGALKQRGDTGLGTFQALDGEMVVLDGEVYQVRGDGSVKQVQDIMETPFACVTFFEPEFLVHVDGLKSLDHLAQLVASAVEQRPNTIYAIRAQGRFDKVRTRSVRKQEKPYPPLIEAVKDQPEFTLDDTHGVLVGFWMPQLVNGLNVPGLHVHYLTNDHEAGGHVLDVQAQSLDIWLDATPQFSMLLPQDGGFQQATLDGVTGDELHKVER